MPRKTFQRDEVFMIKRTKAKRVDNTGVEITLSSGEKFFIPMEDVAAVAVDLVRVLNSERLEWRESAGG